MANTNPLDSLERVDDSTDVIVKLADSKKYKATIRGDRL